ncbi:MAG: hypothetical protein ACTSO6_09060 [Promethearchaeota archaeon]
MEKNKYADLALILALLSLVSPILAILTSQGIIPRILIFGSLAVSGTGLMGLILGIIGYNETDHKWKIYCCDSYLHSRNSCVFNFSIFRNVRCYMGYVFGFTTLLGY